MPSEYYELLALGARYLFTALMLLTLIRAMRVTMIDARRAAELRRLSPDTGVVGEMIVRQGMGRTRTGMRFPVIQEGQIGRRRSADIRLRDYSVRSRHAYFRYRDGMLIVRAETGAYLFDARNGKTVTLRLRDGDSFFVGDIELMLVLNGAEDVSARRRPRPYMDEEDDADNLFDVDSDL